MKWSQTSLCLEAISQRGILGIPPSNAADVLLKEFQPGGWITYTSALRFFSLLLVTSDFLEKLENKMLELKIMLLFLY